MTPPPPPKPLTSEGIWPTPDLRRAFVDGAAWWEFQCTGGTLWTSDRRFAEKEAERRYTGARVEKREEEP